MKINIEEKKEIYKCSTTKKNQNAKKQKKILLQNWRKMIKSEQVFHNEKKNI